MKMMIEFKEFLGSERIKKLKNGIGGSEILNKKFANIASETIQLDEKILLEDHLQGKVEFVLLAGYHDVIKVHLKGRKDLPYSMSNFNNLLEFYDNMDGYITVQSCGDLGDCFVEVFEFNNGHRLILMNIR
jgi:hypothetical protein